MLQVLWRDQAPHLREQGELEREGEMDEIREETRERAGFAVGASKSIVLEGQVKIKTKTMGD